jgi:SAM-dependent methyltransferase
MDDAIIEALCLIHETVERKGPGSDAIALSLIDRIRPRLPKNPRAADMGCGNGYCSLFLAEHLAADVIAVDFCQAFLDELTESLKTQPSAGKVTPRLADMLEPGIEPGSRDLIWSEGAAGSVGTAKAIQTWHSLLAPGGVLVLTDCFWFDTNAPEACKAFWAEYYPQMETVGNMIKAAEDAGYGFLHAERLPSADWWTSYFDPLAVRLKELEKTTDPESVLAQVIAGCLSEQDMFRQYHEYYGYVFLVLKR